MTEDIQTLTRENRFVNQEYAKASHANEILKKQNNELTDRERRALQAQRALELEKEDILQNYREANLEIEQLQSSMQQCAQENRDFYVEKQNQEREYAGINQQIQMLQKKEEGYV